MYPVELYLPEPEVEFTNQSENATSYLWDFGDGSFSDDIDPNHFYNDPGTYFVTLQAADEFGCTQTIIHGPYVVMVPDIFIPNVFSPNNDDINDRFLVEYSGSQPFELQIFDRWGAQVYQSRIKTEGWDGLDQKGSATPEGVYYYHLVIGDRSFSGELTMIR